MHRQQQRRGLMQHVRTDKLKPWLIGVTSLLILTACGPSPNEPRVTSERLRQATSLLEDTVRTEMVWAPDTASELGLGTYAGENHEFRISDHSQAGFERARLLRLDLLDQLGRRPVLPAEHPLARDLAVTTDAYVRLTELQAIGHGRLSLADVSPYAADPFGGIWLSGLDLLSNTHRITNLQDAEGYVARLAALAGAVADTRRRLLADAESGILPPRLLLAKQRELIASLLADDSSTLSGVIDDLENLILSVSTIDTLARDRLLQEASVIVDRDLRSAYIELSDTIGGLLQDSPAQPGLWAQQSSTDLYRALLDWKIGDLPDDLQILHAQNETRVNAARRELEVVWDTANTPDEAVLVETLDVPDLSLAALETFFEPAESEALELFTPTDLTRRSALREDLVSPFGIAIAARAVDGSRPNLLVVNDAQIALWPVWLQDLFLSRAYHVSEVDLADATLASAGRSAIRALVQRPAMRLGWASDQQRLLASQARTTGRALAWQHWLLIEAVIATADTGIHLNRWSVETATQYIAENALLSETIARDIVVHISAYPGTFTTRQVGARRIASLRDRARAILSTTYSESSFGDVVLSDGHRPHSMLINDVETWYETILSNR